jgi:ribosomal protein S12 methylthiotransferase accessory factor
VYRCVESLLNLDGADAYAAALRQLYGNATLDQAQALLSGELRFFGVTAPGAALTGCDMHQRLLAAYGKVRAAQ